ncbi:calcium-binding and coiled-coil domain-containing protein 2 [Bombina bombina]|uniref:calcium-binding and coiled-coil domain-containing protein 2 n=1 Tax=Bombina bombina TaxID=8345 RepID=UPI00235A4874|nr:calcium-binding and coiled-coil domain-containing protein 2 [Bombina bombina]
MDSTSMSVIKDWGPPLECPPTSLEAPENCSYSQVVFNKMQTTYQPGTDIVCYFIYSKNFQSAKKDWVGIFKVGWKTTREWYTWVSAQNKNDSLEKQVTFQAYYLPKDDDYYQFCYVDENGVLRGASISFQFCHGVEKEEEILLVTTEEEALKTKEQQIKSQEIILEQQRKLSAQEKDSRALQEEVSSLKQDKLCQTKQIESLQGDLSISSKKMEELEQQLKVQMDLQRNMNENLELKVKSLEEVNSSLVAKLDKCEKEKETFCLKMKELNLALKTTSDERDNMKMELRKMESLSEQLQGQKEENKKVQKLQNTQRERFQELEHRLKEMYVEMEAAQGKGHTLTHQLKGKERENTILLQKLEEIKCTVMQRDLELADLKREKTDLLQELDEVKCTIRLRDMDIEDLREAHKRVKVETEELRKFRYDQGPFEAAHLFYGNPYDPYPTSTEMNTLKCPHCEQLFLERDRQVFQDHVICHEYDE